ncbi:DUF4367 domain-containing protein [Alkalihalobacillus deserti]|uniref:DUF4367 domain-containing protein n=1 Tax=Alkalihalobacillus deserti TaxID=2879466 RepID=UPI001D147DF0|nr:DUF4367 domain-containing protein [Alkalihalobacillus deserti]
MKQFTILVIFLFSFVLSGCGTQGNLDKTDVLSRASAAVESLNSYSIEMNMDFNLMEIDNTLVATGDITHNPDTMYLDMKMGMPGMTMDFETYVHEDEAYMSMFGDWIKMSPEEMGVTDFDQLTKEQMDKLVQFSDQFEMTEENNMYVLTLSGQGDEYSVLIEDLVQSSMGNLPDDAMDEFVQSIKVNHLDLEIHIDKKTFMQMAQIINTDIEIVEEGTTTPMHLEGRYDISNINEIEPIEIPADVRENAVEDFGEGSFGEEMSIEEIQEKVDFSIPQVTQIPEGYSLTQSIYDESMEMIMLNYDKDFENGFMLSVFPSEGEDAEMPYDEAMDGETVIINGNEAIFYDMEMFYGLTWEQNGLFIDFSGGGPDINKEMFLEIAESIK